MNNTILKALSVGQAVTDSEVTGLSARGLPDSRASFLIRYITKAGKERRPKIGEWPEVTIEEARKRAKLIKAKVALGQDPKGEWDDSKEELTVDELFEKCLKEHWSNERFERSGWKQEVVRLYTRGVKPAFGNCKLSELTPVTIREWHALGDDTPVQANRALEVLSRLFNFAEERDLRPVGSNPCGRVAAFVEKKRRRAASADEILRLRTILDRERTNHPREVTYLLTLLFAGPRTLSLEDITSDHLCVLEQDGERFGKLTFEGKTSEDSGLSEVVILPTFILEMIEALGPQADGTLFGIKFPRLFWERIRKEAGCDDLWARDLRRTYASIGLNAGVALDKLGDMLNHKNTQTTKRYAILNDVEKIKAARQIGEEIARAAKG